MNLPNKITMIRIFLVILVLILLMFPFGSVGLDIPIYKVGTNVTISLNYIIAGTLFVIASFSRLIKSSVVLLTAETTTTI